MTSQTTAARFNRDAKTDAKWSRTLTFQFWLVPRSGTGEDTDLGEELVTFWQKSHNKHSLPFSIVLLKCEPWLQFSGQATPQTQQKAKSGSKPGLCLLSISLITAKKHQCK